MASEARFQNLSMSARLWVRGSVCALYQRSSVHSKSCVRRATAGRRAYALDKYNQVPSALAASCFPHAHRLRSTPPTQPFRIGFMAITIATQFVSFTALAFAAISLVGPGLPVANKVELNTMAATVPDITEIKQHFKFQNLPSLGQFWSSNDTPGNWLYLSNAYARRPAVARLTQDLLWTDDLWYKAQTDPRTHSRADIDKFWNRASEAMASVSSGVVYVLLPGPSVNPTKWSNTSTWALFEYPMLIRNGTTVEKICRVNYNYEFNEYTTPFKIWPEVDENQC